MPDGLLLEKTGSIASITFDRPDKANTLDVTWLGAMQEYLQATADDASVRVVLLRGNGKHFRAGGDLQFLGQLALQGPDERTAAASSAIQACNSLEYSMRNLGKPIVASV